MYDKYGRNDSLVSWMIAGGARINEPNPRDIAHLVALRDAKREASPAVSPIAWLTARFGTKSAVSTVPASATNCCAPA